ncbi:MAG: phosphodiester glycosidase family protein [Gemmatimonadota bacterium]
MRAGVTRRRVAVIAAGALASGVLASCASGTASSRPTVARAAEGGTDAFRGTGADSIITERVAPGVQLHRLVNLSAPWRAFVLDVDLTACVSLQSVKGAAGAEGRRTTSSLLASLRPRVTPIAAVNADFFLFAPPGVPTGAHIESGQLISGPIARPVFGVHRDGTPYIGTLSVRATVTGSRGSMLVTSWNRPTRNVPGIVDERWGVALDSTITGTVRTLVPVSADGDRYVVRAAAESPAGASAPASRVARGDTLFLIEVPAAEGTVVVGDTVRVTRDITPRDIRHAVGGMPVLLRDSVVVGAVDSVSNASFRGVNPRTAIGVAAGGRRVFMVVIDGRQPGYSAGMSLRETASLLRGLGARDGVNLDGGGSSAMVVARASGSAVVNRTSDPTGERPVANAVAVVQGCATR